MKFCPECGTALSLKFHPRENKELPFCETCGRYRYPEYNTAVSMVVTDQEKKRILLIRQYGGDSCILVAGYINKGENAEAAAAREIKEELGLDVASVHYNRSQYFPKSNTLMLNFTCTVENMRAQPNSEIDSWGVYSFEEAREQIRHGSLAEHFLLEWMQDQKALN